MRAPGTHTLSPVATGAIAVDNQYLLAGSYARKHAVQLDWEASATTFWGASRSGQRISNLVAANGRLFAQNTGALFDNVATIAPVVLGQTTWRHEARSFSLLRLTWLLPLPRPLMDTSVPSAMARNSGCREDCRISSRPLIWAVIASARAAKRANLSSTLLSELAELELEISSRSSKTWPMPLS